MNSLSECFRFGINDGCKTYCPVFERGDCKIEDPELFTDMIIDDDNLSNEDLQNIILLYPILNRNLRRKKLEKIKNNYEH